MNTDPKYLVSSLGSELSLALANNFARILRLGDVVEFVGDLGGGKTQFIKGLAAGLGITQTVTSPTYNVQRSYKIPVSESFSSGGMLEHYDLYRLGDDQILIQEMREIIAAGDAILCIEWADRFSEHLSEDRFVIRAEYVDENERCYEFAGTGLESRSRLDELAKTSGWEALV